MVTKEPEFGGKEKLWPGGKRDESQVNKQGWMDGIDIRDICHVSCFLASASH